jgi:hypothetical protein
MNATDLYEIVRDVPREAWPEQFDWYSEEGQSDYRCFTVNGEEYNYKNNLLETTFVGSMTAWLARKEASCVRVDNCYRPDAFKVVHMRDGHDTKISCAASIVAALAAACKEVSNG